MPGFGKQATNHLLIMRQELANALQSAHPKIQKMCEEESDDSEAVAKLLEINDSIHRTIERYKLVKKGDLEGASKIPKGTLGTSTGVSKSADDELTLIDFGGDPEPIANGGSSANSAQEQKTGQVEDDLLGLSLQDQSYGQGGGIALGFGENTSRSPALGCQTRGMETDFRLKTYLGHLCYPQQCRTAQPDLPPQAERLNLSNLQRCKNQIMTLLLH